ncbi:pentatricopeptide repeat-containing protein like [Capsicum chacoense]|uniref:Pentatricopeptide repeat-containing protein n=1 Tax=Capsicum annuum TaxID=4072 RepID=A0A1U8FT74_CAPAN|nr:pentatricopeptide repeat-containing protein At2g33680 [Capsicum annuum]XP_047258222.1 pentatricopeptide repeat-containing protein At2g33680-like [Capsicum annuum]XP_047258233.1 pentatricopeptide repeat-containing protein At2g33680-like [Capsicum annuum]XP_047258234.1 pentatricopeptide repeat-containing protein At2g33680-like [Capsicum annuum]KAF3627654.1 Pentatricopeptide repeat-containing protein [Capsicum annuum]KAF3644754.1 Pentatricopeptide repeat-containing protein [Capsicum annuum]PH
MSYGPISVAIESSSSLFTKILHYTQSTNLPKGQSLHAHLIKIGSSSSCIYLSNSIVNLYAKCHRLSDAHLAFQEIQNKDVVSWNCLINGYSQSGRRDSSISVLKLFKQMRQENALPNPHTFAGIFSAVSSLGDAGFTGKQEHCLAFKLGYLSDVFVGSSLLNVYCKAGRNHIVEARKMFDEMPERNSVSWTTMISGYAWQRLVKEAVGVFRVMLWERGDDANEFVFTSVLSAIALPEFINVGKQIHCLSLKNGYLWTVSVANATVTMYAKCGSLDDACSAFELSSEKNSITWSALITGYAQNGDCEKALKLFSEMHYSGMNPSEYTLVGVLNACSDFDALREGKQVHGYLLKLGFEPQMYILTALVDMYAKCGNISDARSGFDYLKEPDIVLWTSMIAGYVKNGDNENAMGMYCRMLKEGVIPNELTMASVLKACSSLAALEQGKQIHAHIVKHGFRLEVPIGSALSTMYAKSGSLHDGNLVFRRMPARDLVSWNSMMSGLSQNGCGTDALELFEEMLLEGTKPDYVTFVNILSACSHIGLVERGWSIFKMMSNEFGIEPRLEHFACMVDMFGRAGKLYEAKEFIVSAASQVDHGLCLWRILLSACRNYRNYELGAYAGEKLIELGSQESSAYVLLSSIYSALGRLEDVERVRRLMNLRGVSKEPGCSWIELKSQFHVFVVGDQLHPQIIHVRKELWKLSKLMKDEGYKPHFDPCLELEEL